MYNAVYCFEFYSLVTKIYVGNCLKLVAPFDFMYGDSSMTIPKILFI